MRDEDLRGLLSREVGIEDVLPGVNEIVMEVASKGDRALFEYTKKFEGAKLDRLRVSQRGDRCRYEATDDKLIVALSGSAENIFAFHYEQLDRDFWMT